MLPKLLVHEIAFSVVASHEVYLHNTSQEKLQPASASAAAYFGLNPFIAVRSRRLRAAAREGASDCPRCVGHEQAVTWGPHFIAWVETDTGFPQRSGALKALTAPGFCTAADRVDRVASRNTSAVAKRLGRLAIDLRNELVCVTTCSSQPDHLRPPLVLSKMPMAFL